MERMNISRIIICACFLMSGCAKNIPDVVKNPPQGQVSCYQNINALKVLDKNILMCIKSSLIKLMNYMSFTISKSRSWIVNLRKLLNSKLIVS